MGYKQSTESCECGAEDADRACELLSAALIVRDLTERPSLRISLARCPGCGRAFVRIHGSRSRADSQSSETSTIYHPIREPLVDEFRHADSGSIEILLWNRVPRARAIHVHDPGDGSGMRCVFDTGCIAIPPHD